MYSILSLISVVDCTIVNIRRGDLTRCNYPLYVMVFYYCIRVSSELLANNSTKCSAFTETNLVITAN